MREIVVQAGASRYAVEIGAGLIKELPARLRDMFPKTRFAIVTDENVAALYAGELTDALTHSGVQHRMFTVAPGEGSKSMETLSRLFSGFAQEGFTRSDVVVALGGGVVGDLAGFAASVYLRGVKYVQIPTTLLAQIDSAVGGKTAVNLPEGKNLVGAFYQPAFVCADTETLRTLPAEAFADGMAELIKYALIRDADVFVQLEEGPVVTADSPELMDLVARCVAIKRDVVGADERDTGERMIPQLWPYDRARHRAAVRAAEAADDARARRRHGDGGDHTGGRAHGFNRKRHFGARHIRAEKVRAAA